MDDEIERATNLFLLWNGNIVATFIFYIVHIVTDSHLLISFSAFYASTLMDATPNKAP